MRPECSVHAEQYDEWPGGTLQMEPLDRQKDRLASVSDNNEKREEL